VCSQGWGANGASQPPFTIIRLDSDAKVVIGFIPDCRYPSRKRKWCQLPTSDQASHSRPSQSQVTHAGVPHSSILLISTVILCTRRVPNVCLCSETFSPQVISQAYDWTKSQATGRPHAAPPQLCCTLPNSSPTARYHAGDLEESKEGLCAHLNVGMCASTRLTFALVWSSLSRILPSSVN
jgi:hypothetical protein